MKHKSKYYKEEHEWNLLGITFPKSNELGIRCKYVWQFLRLYKTLKACGYDFVSEKSWPIANKSGWNRWFNGCYGFVLSKYLPNGTMQSLDCEIDDEVTYKEFNDMLAGNS